MTDKEKEEAMENIKRFAEEIDKLCNNGAISLPVTDNPGKIGFYGEFKG